MFSVLSIRQIRKTIHETTHTRNHVCFLHPLGIHWPAFRLTFLSSFKYCLMDIITLSTRASMYAMKTFALIFTVRLNQANSLSIRAMISARMFAETFQILAAKNRNVSKKLALAFAVFAVNLLRLDIVKVMVFKTMSAKTRTCRSNSSTILSRVLISPVYI